ncbi:MAG: type II secretion system protein [Planctomycetes bacterium]|nr:type II secretion system protein [Planctomycetota bacterium]
MMKRSAISGQSLTRGAAAPQEIARRSPRVKGQQSATPKLSALSYQLLARGRSRRSLVLSPVFDPEAEPQAQTRREPRTLNPSFAPAFTLTELLVSLVILVGMMTLIATIFATAGKSSGVAQVQTRLHRQLLQVADVMRVDLANTVPGMGGAGPSGVLAIAGVAVEAKDTAKSPDTSVRRADVLMLLTQQQFEPFIYEPPAGTFLDNYKQVVYGHADIGKLLPDLSGQWFPGSIKHVENAAAEGWLASEWHLARRVVGFVKTAMDYSDTAQWPRNSRSILGTDPGGFTTDVAGPSVSTALSSIMPGHYVYRRDDDAQMSLQRCYFENADGRFYWQTSYYLLAEDPFDVTTYWWLDDGYTPPSVLNRKWRREDSRRGGTVSLPFSLTKWPPLVSGYRYPLNAEAQMMYYWPRWFYYPAGAAGPIDSYRTRIDPMPPPGMPKRTAAYFLPSCSEFKVEFTYDDPREVVVGTDGQPVLADTNGDGIVSPPGSGPPDAPAASPVNWQTVPPGHMYVWTGLSTDTNNYTAPGDLRDRTFPFRWPRALRITMRAYAPGGALDYPITHSLIHVWQ